MELQQRRVSERAQYFFDGASEGGEMDTGSALCLQLYGDRDEIDRIIIGQERSRWRNTTHICVELMDYADRILAETPKPRRTELIAIGVASLHHYVVSLAEILGMWAVEDIVEGGCLDPFRHGRDIRSRDGYGGVPTPKWNRRLHARSWIRRYVRNNGAAGSLRSLARRTIARAFTVGHRRVEDLTPDVEAIFAEIASQAPAPTDPEYDRLRDIQAGVNQTDWADRPLVQLRPGVKKRLRKQREMTKRMLKRAVKLTTATFGAETTAAILRRQEITVSGAAVILGLKLSGRVSAVGHGAIMVSVKTTAGALLATLCVYFDRTPVLDQFVAFALYMQAGLEAEIIKAANLTHVAPDGVGHPLFAERHRREQEAMDRIRAPLPEGADGGRRRDNTVRDHNRVRRRNEAYYAETRAIWEHELGVFALGRNFNPNALRRG